jgi:uncharacterized protein (DUF1786 family)
VVYRPAQTVRAPAHRVQRGRSVKKSALIIGSSAGIGAGVLETRRGVGSFVSAPPERARTAREHERRLKAFATQVVADAAAAGFTVGEVVEALGSHQQGEA